MIDPELTGKECRRAVYCPSKDGKSDMIFVKEHHHFSDGTTKPEINQLINFKRDFYLTKEAFRNHKEKKEWEELSKLQKYSCPQHELARRVAMVTNNYNIVNNPRSMGNNPYLYGTEVPVESIVKYLYQRKYPKAKSPLATVSALDIETDVIWGTGEILMVANVFEDKLVLPINKRFAEGRGITNFTQRVVERAWELIPHILNELGVKELDVTIEASPATCVKKAIAFSHETRPDLVSIWNSHFDVPRMVAALTLEGYDPADIFSDPSVPPKYRYFRYKEGSKVQMTASGKLKNLADYDRWHKCSYPATWFIVDSMAVYKTIRTANGNEPDYTLEGVTQRNLGYGKLNFAEVDKLEKLAWHIAMQRDYPIEYCVYAMMDVLLLLALDKKIKDLASAYPVLCDLSRFEDFKQNPLKIVDDMHFFALENDNVIASRPMDVETPLDKYVIGKDHWIVTLQASLMASEGVNVFDAASQSWNTPTFTPYVNNGLSGMHPNVYLNNSDIDVAATYPRLQDVLNMSKGTTRLELYEILGMDQMTRRRYGVNLVCGEVNAIRTCVEGMGMPTPHELLERFKKKYELT